MDAFLISFGIIFVAELGDKSQLMAMTFAARYRAMTILIAITAATAFVHLFSVLIGAAVGVAMPTKAISVVIVLTNLISCSLRSAPGKRGLIGRNATSKSGNFSSSSKRRTA